jgi:hypothetical protein
MHRFGPALTLVRKTCHRNCSERPRFVSGLPYDSPEQDLPARMAEHEGKPYVARVSLGHKKNLRCAFCGQG